MLASSAPFCTCDRKRARGEAEVVSGARPRNLGILCGWRPQTPTTSSSMRSKRDGSTSTAPAHLHPQLEQALVGVVQGGLQAC